MELLLLPSEEAQFCHLLTHFLEENAFKRQPKLPFNGAALEAEYWGEIRELPQKLGSAMAWGMLTAHSWARGICWAYLQGTFGLLSAPVWEGVQKNRWKRKERRGKKDLCFSDKGFLRSSDYSAAMEKTAEDVNNLQDYAKAKLQLFYWKNAWGLSI